MVARKPYVNVSGVDSELPAGDTLALFGDLATPDQFADVDGNIAEVEATLALRTTLRAFGDMSDPAFCCYRYAMGFQTSHIATTTFLANSEILSLMNLTQYPIAMRRIGISAGTSAVTGARVGLARICALEMFACTAMYNTAFLFNPPVGIAPNLGAFAGGLKTRQNPPGLLIGCSQNAVAPNSIPGFSATVSGGRSIGEVTGGAPSAVGTNIKPTWIFDSYGEEPYWIAPTRGLYINSTFPAAATSQTINYAVSLVWDEWQPATPR